MKTTQHFFNVSAKRLTLAVVGLFIFCVATAQKTVVEPDFTGRPYFVDSLSNQLIPMERISGEIGYKTKGMGFGGGEGFIICEGDRSNVRFKAAVPKAIIKVGDNQDPADFIFLSKAIINKKNKRQFVLVKQEGFAGTKDVSAETKLGLTFTRIDKNLYYITIPSGIPAGEYAIIGGGDLANGVLKLPCFGID